VCVCVCVCVCVRLSVCTKMMWKLIRTHTDTQIYIYSCLEKVIFMPLMCTRGFNILVHLK